MKRKIIPIFVPHIGCPHDCIFCNQKKITGAGTDVTAESAEAIIKEHLGTIDAKNCIVEIAFFGGSFTAIEESFQRSLLSVASKYKQSGVVRDIRLSTRPDAIDESRLALLKEYGVTTIELGVQSLDGEVLSRSLRGHTGEDVHAAAALIKDWGFTLGLQLMVGLPGDSPEKCLETAREFIDIGPEFARIYPTLVVKDTALERLHAEGAYKALEIEETIEICKKLLVLLTSAGIKVIRIGLQPTEEISMGNQVVAGPLHPSLRERVESRIFRDYIEAALLSKEKAACLRVYGSKRNMSKLVGNKRENISYLRGLSPASVEMKEAQMPDDAIAIEIDGKKRIVDISQVYLELGRIYF
ncbi:radical SAM-superfamily protein [Peptoclostridium acidaminophilum DSM 3953]|uniref:Radical SAM-superfamily protein n=1 Tax=Peptoclostridium acidaminophilum DSM 3953 TaxID=1286171 RepID=W8U6H0_PEPAC|nr:radical SAM protein [Peptoclostridium acidaminophilum]AHM56521.1 radical SAM-superfamily protein [Peptoclostridium acidaminophilum DSM 3953]